MKDRSPIQAALLAFTALVMLAGLFLIPRLDASRSLFAKLTSTAETPDSEPEPIAKPTPAPPAAPQPVEIPGRVVALSPEGNFVATTEPDPKLEIEIGPAAPISVYIPPEITEVKPPEPPAVNENAEVDHVALVSPGSPLGESDPQNSVIVVSDPSLAEILANPPPDVEPPPTLQLAAAEPELATTIVIVDPPTPNPAPPASELDEGVLGKIEFAGDSTRLTDVSNAELTRIAGEIAATEDLKVLLRGHATLESGDEAHHLWVSGVRARRIMGALLDLGVSEDAIEIEAAGPAEDGKGAHRVDILILSE
ncbi:MAG: outer membrane protein OmpA-like peptidoglycan-associated protein [Verrucomicrobiales bacterium]|jgi:outer membrane protein OmpA-like peptidoglycan-associated protein